MILWFDLFLKMSDTAEQICATVVTANFEQAPSLSGNCSKSHWKGLSLQERFEYGVINQRPKNFSVFFGAIIKGNQVQFQCSDYGRIVICDTIEDVEAIVNDGVLYSDLLTAIVLRNSGIDSHRLVYSGSCKIAAPTRRKAIMQMFGGIKRVAELASSPEAKTFMGKVEKALDQFDEVSPSLQSTLRHYDALAVKLNSTLDTLLSTINSTIQHVSELCPFVADVLLFVADIIRECLAPHKLGITLLGVKFIKTFSLNTKSISFILGHFKNLHSSFTTVNTVEATENSGVVDVGLEMREGEMQISLDVFNSIIVLIGAAMKRSIIGIDILAKNVGERCRTLCNITNGAKSLKEVFLAFIPALPEVVQEWMSVLCPWSEFQACCEKLQVPETLFQLNLFLRDEVKYQLLHDSMLQRQLFGYRDWIVQAIESMKMCAKEAPGYYSMLLSKAATLHKWVADFNTAIGLDGKRAEPFCVYMAGLPGVGKSVLATLLTKVLIPANVVPSARVYNRCPGTEFWDAYTGQYAVVYDEFAQDTQGRDCNELISLKSNSKFLPPMASIDNGAVGIKGTPFTSNLVVCCSNIGYPTSPTVADNNAIWRRRDIFVEVVVKPEYSNEKGALNVLGTPRAVLRKFDHLRFVVRDSRTMNAEPLVVFDNIIAFLTYVAQQRGVFQERVADLNDEHYLDAVLEEFAAARNGDMQMDEVQENRYRSVYTVNNEQVAFMEAVDGDEGTNAVVTTLPTMSWYELQCIGCDGSQRFRAKLKGSTKWEDVTDLVNKQHAIQLQLKMLYAKAESMLAQFLGAHPWLKGFALLTGALTAVGAFIALALWSSQKRGADAQMANSSAGEVSTKSTRKINTNVLRKAHMQSNDAEVLADEFVLLNKLKENQCFVETDTGESLFKMQGLFIYDTVAMLPKHFFYSSGNIMCEGQTIKILVSGHEYYDAFASANLFELPLLDERFDKRDLVAYRFTRSIPPRPKIVTQFIREAELLKIVKRKGWIAMNTNGTFRVEALEQLSYTKQVTEYSNTNKSLSFVNPRGFEYSGVSTSRGDCGATIICSEPEPRIVGVHVALLKQGDIGIAEMVRGEDVALVVEHFAPKNIRDGDMQICFEKRRSSFVPKGQFKTIGILPRSQAVRIPTKTKIVPSLIFEDVSKHVKEPACLHPNDPRILPQFRTNSLLVRAFEGYGEVTGPIYEPYLDKCVQYVIDQLPRQDKYHKLGVLSIEEAINGIKGLDYVDRLNMATSSGYSWKVPNRKGKWNWFEEISTDELLAKPEVLEAVKKREEFAKEGIKYPHIWIATLKDEKLKMNKIEQGAPRAFDVGMLDMILLSRRYFLAFNANLYSLHNESFSAIGMDPESCEWAHMIEYLTQVSDKGFDADFESWDKRLPAPFILAACDIINAWYDDGPENARVREVLFHDLVFSKVLISDALVQTDHGMKSGHSLTIVVNTLANVLKHLYAWLVLQPGEKEFKTFGTDVRLKALGDDCLLFVHERSKEFYNYDCIKKVFEVFGDVVKPGDKGDANFVARKPEMLTFLKRSTVLLPQFPKKVARLELVSIMEMMNWVNKELDPIDALEDNIETALRFLVFHGKDLFTVIRKRVICAIQKRNLKIFVPTYDDCLLKVSPAFGINIQKVPMREALLQMETIPSPSPNTVVLDNLGVALVQRVKPVEVDATTSTIVSRPMTASVSEQQWSLVELAAKENFVEVLQWTSSATFSAPIKAYLVPNDLIKADNSLEKAFAATTFFRGDFIVTIQVSGTKFHQGILLVCYTPLTAIASLTYQSATLVQHVFLDASKSTATQMRISYRAPTPYLTTDNTITNVLQRLGTLYVYAFDALNYAAGASTTLDINITVHMDPSNTQFFVPRGVSSGPTVKLAVPEKKTQNPIIGAADGNINEEARIAVMQMDDTDHPLTQAETMAPTTNLNKQLGVVNSGDFCDEVVSLRDLAKRFVPLGTSTLFATPITIPGLPTQNMHLVVFDACCALYPTYNTGILGICSNIFAMYRGSLRYYVTFSMPSVVNDAVFFAMFMPGSVLGTSVSGPLRPPSPESIVMMYRKLGIVPNSVGNAVIGPSSSSTPVASVSPIILAQSSAPSLSFEIPFVSLYEQLYTAYGSYNTTTPASLGFTTGYVAVGCYTGRSANSELTGTRVALYGAMGDSGRFNAIRGCPKLFISGWSDGSTLKSYPCDVYASPSLAVSQTTVKADDKKKDINARVGFMQGNHISYFQKFGSVVNSTLPTNVTGDAFDLQAKNDGNLAMDKPSNTLTCLPFYRFGAPSLQTAVGLFPSEPMLLTPSEVTLSTPELFATNIDEMKISYLVQHMTLSSIIPWNTTHVAGTLLWNQSVRPLASLSTGVVGVTYALPFMDIIAKNFLYWAGSMRYRFMIACTGLHTGKLWIGMNYTNSPPANLDQAMRQYGMMIDLGADKHDFVVEVPYKSIYPHLLVPPGGSSDFGTKLGFLSVFVVNRLVVPPGVPTSVNIYMSIGGGEDFKLAVPADRGSSLLPVF